MPKDPRSYVQELAENAQRYMRELRAENQAWREVVTSMVQSRSGVEDQLLALQERLRAHDAGADTAAMREAELQGRVAMIRASIEGHRAERASLETRVRELESRSETLTSHCAAVEEQHVYVTNLYVATDRLHRTLERREVLEGVVEIVVNLVGSEEFGIFELSPSGKTATYLAGFGVEPSALASVPITAGPVARSIESGRTFIPGPAATFQTFAGLDVVASVPLATQGRVFGVIVIFSLLSHKARLTTVDLELFQLLSLHAGTALHASALCSAPFMENGAHSSPPRDEGAVAAGGGS